MVRRRPSNPYPNSHAPTDTLVKLADHAAGKDDRWLMLALLIVLLGGLGWIVWTLSKRLTAITDRHIAQGERMSEVVANNTSALTANTEVLSAVRYKLTSSTSTHLLLLLAVASWLLTGRLGAAQITLTWDAVPPSSNYVVSGYTLHYGVMNGTVFEGTNTVAIPTNTLVYTATGIPGKRCFFFLTARAESGETSEPSNVIFDTFPSAAPPAPRNLRVTGRKL